MHEMFLPMNKNVKVLLNMFDLVINQSQDGLVTVYLVYTKPFSPTFEN